MENLFALAAGAVVVVIIGIAVAIALYVLSSLGTYKVLKKLNYANPWMAWIPVLSLFALAHVTGNEEGNTKVLGYDVPTMVFSFWWIVYAAVSYIPHVGGLLATAVCVICLGTCFINIYSRCENKSEQEVTAIGYVSGLIPIIAYCKFLSYKND